MKMILRQSFESEVEELTRMSIEAFHTDYLVGGDPEDGPPDYDSVFWHEEMRTQGNLYSYLDGKGNMVGGAVLFSKKDMVYVGRVFIDPLYHKMGYGYQLMLDIEELFSETKKFKLDTPLVNIRTNRLYQKVGYQEIDRDVDTITYEKIRK